MADEKLDALDARIASAYRFAADKLARGQRPEQVRWMLVRDGVPERAADLILTMVGDKLAKVRRRGARYRRAGAVLVTGGVALIAAAAAGPWGWAIAAIGVVMYGQGWLLS